MQAISRCLARPAMSFHPSAASSGNCHSLRATGADVSRLCSGRRTCILLQNENGPCPLLAIANILQLRNHLGIHPDRAFITFHEVLGLVGNYICEANPPHRDESLRLNQQQQISDVIDVLPTLSHGTDDTTRGIPSTARRAHTACNTTRACRVQHDARMPRAT